MIISFIMLDSPLRVEVGKRMLTKVFERRLVTLVTLETRFPVTPNVCARPRVSSLSRKRVCTVTSVTRFSMESTT